MAQKYHKRLVEFESLLPLIRALRTPGMRHRHWARLFEEFGGGLAKVDRDLWTLHTLVGGGLRV